MKRLCKDKQLVKDTLKEAPQKCDIGDEKEGINFEGFVKILYYFCRELSIEAPTESDLFSLFQEFNDKSSGDGLFFPNEYSNFIEKMLEMLSAAEFKY